MIFFCDKIESSFFFRSFSIVSNSFKFFLCINSNCFLKDIPANEIDTIDEARVKTIIEASGTNDNNVIKKINKDIVIRNGKYGPYINYKKTFNVKIWGKIKPADLTLKDCMDLITKKQAKSSKS